MSTIYRQGRDGIWQYETCVKGRRIKRSLRTRDEGVAKGMKAQLDVAFDERPLSEGTLIMLADLVRRYLEYAAGYYRTQDGTPTSTLCRVRAALRPLLAEPYVALCATQFGPRMFRRLMERWADTSHSRRTCNTYAGVVKQMFRWGVEEELVPGSHYQAIAAVALLRKGRTQAREPRVVRPVLPEHLDALLPHLTRPVRAMVELQVLTGARGGELCILRPCDVDRTGDVWIARPTAHKSTWREQGREIYLGPKAKMVLRPFILDRAPGTYLFSPRESVAEIAARAPTHRRPLQRIEPRVTDRRVRDHFDKDSYRRALLSASAKAGVPAITPHRLRHTAGTAVEREYGLLGAQLILGHRRADVTELYVERNRDMAMEIAGQMG